MIDPLDALDRVYAGLAWRCDDDGTVQVSQSELAELVELPLDIVRAVLTLLLAGDYLRRMPRRGRENNATTYVLTATPGVPMLRLVTEVAR